MNHEDLLVYAQAVANRTGADFALLATPFQFSRTRFASGVQGTFDDESPIANILHAEDEDLDDMFIFSSYEPSEMDLGLAWRSKVSAIYWLEFPARYRIYTVGDDGSAYRTASTMQSNLHTKLPDNAWCNTYVTTAQAADQRLVGGTQAPRNARPLSDVVTLRLKHGLGGRRAVQAARGQMKTDDDFMRIVYALVSCGWNDPAPRGERHINVPRPFGNNIGGIIVDDTNRIIAWGLNMKEVNKTFHAETMMILAYLRRHNLNRLPDGCTVYTSLECCYMCAGHIATLGRNIRVVYGQKDPNIAGDNALARGVNGCTQCSTSLPYAGLLSRAQGGQNIIDFLFGQDPVQPNRLVRTDHMFARPALDVQLFNELRARTGNQEAQSPQAIIREGDVFLRELQAAGLLHGLTA